MDKEKSGHPCPSCNSTVVYCEHYVRNENGSFLYKYHCCACDFTFESTPSHKEAEDEK